MTAHEGPWRCRERRVLPPSPGHSGPCTAAAADQSWASLLPEQGGAGSVRFHGCGEVPRAHSDVQFLAAFVGEEQGTPQVRERTAEALGVRSQSQRRAVRGTRTRDSVARTALSWPRPLHGLHFAFLVLSVLLLRSRAAPRLLSTPFPRLIPSLALVVAGASAALPLPEQGVEAQGHASELPAESSARHSEAEGGGQRPGVSAGGGPSRSLLSLFSRKKDEEPAKAGHLPERRPQPGPEEKVHLVAGLWQRLLSGAKGQGTAAVLVAETVAPAPAPLPPAEGQDAGVVEVVSDGDMDGIAMRITSTVSKKNATGAASNATHGDPKQAQAGVLVGRRLGARGAASGLGLGEEGEAGQAGKAAEGAGGGAAGAGGSWDLFGGGKSKATSTASEDNNSEHYEQEAGGEAGNAKDGEGGGEKAEGKGGGERRGEGVGAEGLKGAQKKGEVEEMVEKILERLDDPEDKGGKFNETLEKDEGVLETVARVGKHHKEEAQEDEEEAQGDGNAAQDDPAKAGDATGGEAKQETASRATAEGGAGSSSAKAVSANGQGAGTGDKDAGGTGGDAGGGASDRSKGNKASKGKNQFDGMTAWGSGAGGGKGDLSLMALLFGRDDSQGPPKPPPQNRPPGAPHGLPGAGNHTRRNHTRAHGHRTRRVEREGEDDKDVARLIDSQDNEYVISNPGKGSKMQMQEDFTLISDIVKVIVAAAIGGLLCGLLGQPVILGYIVAGMIIGPGGLGLIHELVQVETLAQFGVVFLLFALGVEFNLAKMQGCQGVALGGGMLAILVAMTLGGLFSSNTPQGIFIGGFLSMSSTAVVLKCLMDINSTNTEHGQIMLGTLIAQDCALGLLLAIMPALAARTSSALSIAWALLKELMLLLLFCSLAWVLARVLIPRFLRMLVRLSRFSMELYQMGIVGNCLCVALLSEYLGLSLEVGAFVAGLMLSGGAFSERTLHQVEPIRNIFAALFLASIGMVMHPHFLWQHKDILLVALAVVFFGKALLTGCVVRLFGYSAGTAAAVGVALAQIGEFSFVLLSRAQTLRLVSHKMYLLLMGTTALSLVLTPFAFKLVPRFVGIPERPKKERSSGPGSGKKGDGRDRPGSSGPSALAPSTAVLRGDPGAVLGGATWGALRGSGSGSWDVREAGAGYWGAEHANAGGGGGGHHPDKAGAREQWSYTEAGEQPMGAALGGAAGAPKSLRIRGTKGSLASPSGLGPSIDGEGGGGGAPDLSLGGGRGGASGLSEDFFARAPPGSYGGGAGSVSALVSSPSQTPPGAHHHHTPFSHQHYPHATASSKPSGLGPAFVNMFSSSAASLAHKQNQK